MPDNSKFCTNCGMPADGSKKELRNNPGDIHEIGRLDQNSDTEGLDKQGDKGISEQSPDMDASGKAGAAKAKVSLLKPTKALEDVASPSANVINDTPTRAEEKAGGLKISNFNIFLAIVLLIGVGFLIAYANLRDRSGEASAHTESFVEYNLGEDAYEPAAYVPEETPAYADTYPETTATYSSGEPFSMSNIVSVTSSSHLVEGGRVHSVERIIDGDYATAWSEGVSGYGEGESIVIRFDKEYVIHGISMASGYHKSEDLYYKNGRPMTLRINIVGEDSIYWTLEDKGLYTQNLVFNKAISTDAIEIVLVNAYPGSKYEDTCISELLIF